MTTESLKIPARAKARLALSVLNDNPCKGKTEEEITKMVKEAMIHQDQMEALLINMLLKFNAM